MNFASSADQPSGDGRPQRSGPHASPTTASAPHTSPTTPSTPRTSPAARTSSTATSTPRTGASAVRRAGGEPAQKAGSAEAIASGMLFRSTGLGKAELVASVTSLRSQGDYLIMEMETTEPVRWRIRGGVSHRDIRRILRLVLTRSVLPFLLDPRRWFKKPVHPGDF